MNARGFRATLAPALCMLIATCAAAQAPESPRVDLGAPGEEHRKLDALAGTWDVTLKIPIGAGRHVEGQASYEAKWVLDGRFLLQEYSSTFAGKPLKVVRYLGFDRNQGKFVELHFESTHTDVMHSEGTLSGDGKAITCWGMHVDATTGQAVKVRTVTTLPEKDTFTLEMVYTDSEGKDSKTITLTHTKRNAE